VRQLLWIANKENIIVEYTKLKYSIRGFYCKEPGCLPVIGLDDSLYSDHRLHRCVMAEELGHHFTSVGELIAKKHYSLQDRLSIDKIEYKALRWAANYLIPENDLLDAIKEGLYENWELAEHFDVTDTFMGFRMRLFGVRQESI
jgi:Zn-dependent peptidase ImmA (M78 family)